MPKKKEMKVFRIKGCSGKPRIAWNEWMKWAETFAQESRPIDIINVISASEITVSNAPMCNEQSKLPVAVLLKWPIIFSL